MVTWQLPGAIPYKWLTIIYLQLNYSHFSGLPERKNILCARDAGCARKSLLPETDAEDLNSFKSSA